MRVSVPILVISDAPDQSTGLARIARDICGLLHANREMLDIEVAQVGWQHDEAQRFPWRVYNMRDTDEWGAKDLPKRWWAEYGNRRGVVLTIWDPGRCFSLSESAADSPVQLWGYFAVDSTSLNGGLTGPPQVALQRYRRVLAYGPWGASVLKKTLGKGVQWLPHGLDLGVWKYQPMLELPALDTPEGAKPKVVSVEKLVGCVATNQPRKDYGLLFQAWRMMADRDANLKFWLHTDEPVRHWSVPQLAEDLALSERLAVTTPESLTSDEDLAAMYSQCIVTIAPGLGEGWGYPIAESLACGTPVIVVNHAGGAGLVPIPAWRVEPRMWRLEGAYAQLRPVLEPYEMASAALGAIEWRREEPEVVSQYCRGAVEAFSWKNLAGYWLSWMAAGLAEVRE